MLLPILLFVMHVAALVTQTPAQDVAKLLINHARPTPTDWSIQSTKTQDTKTTSLSSGDLTRSTLVTIAPLSRNPLESRQKCFNDQGFSVDCATWTGYYYTWGGSGHPYAGGPGDEGNGDGSSGNGFHYVGSAMNLALPLTLTALVTVLTMAWLLVT